MKSEKLEARFRRHFDRTYGRRGYHFTRYLPAYQYGASLAEEQRFAGRAWRDIELDVRRSWDSREGGPWEEYKEAVRAGWELSVRMHTN